MNRSVLILLLLGLAWAPAHADDDARDPIASSAARVTPERPYVGQRTAVSLVLRTSSFFQGAPTWHVPEIDGAIVRQESAFAVNGTETIDGQTFVTQTFKIAVYPQALGRFEVPGIDVTMRVSKDGVPVDVAARTEPTAFETRLPEGATESTFALSTPAFVGTVELDRALDGLVVGDAVRRTVTLTVEAAPGMLIPPQRPITFDGVSAYADPPRVDDRMNRGDITGTRIESTTFVFEQPGRYVIPAMRIPWFDLDTEQLRDVELDRIVFEVGVDPDAVVGGASTGTDTSDGVATPPPAQWLVPVAVCLTLLVLFGLVVFRLAPGVRTRVAARRSGRAESEAGYFARLEAACDTDDPHATLRALLAWLDCRAAPRSGSLPAFVRRSDDPALAAAVRDLEDRLYGADGSVSGWTGATLRDAVRVARHRTDTGPDVDDEPLRLNPTPRAR